MTLKTIPNPRGEARWYKKSDLVLLRTESLEMLYQKIRVINGEDALNAFKALTKGIEPNPNLTFRPSKPFDKVSPETYHVADNETLTHARSLAKALIGEQEYITFAAEANREMDEAVAAIAGDGETIFIHYHGRCIYDDECPVSITCQIGGKHQDS